MSIETHGTGHALFGRCACGATLTAEHIRNRCPLRPQQELSEASIAAVAACVNDATERWWNTRLDITHVAELGYN